ncbi:MAG: prephenate dehydratase [Dehalococcoidia bacterium]|nr:prephenate dehydratase [Dehalococcoidia bacterium]
MSRVAYQGERGAYSEDAVVRFFGDVELLPCRTIRDVFQIVAGDRADFGVVPVENSQAGSINETYDLLLKFDLNICGEIALEVNHCLMAPPGESLDSIKTVYSHPQALAQCEEFLRKLDAEIIPSYDTAGSAKLIKEKSLVHCAAVASKRVAEIYQMQTLAEDIQTIHDNYTKFFVISKKKAERAKQNKTSLVFATKNAPGALHDCLGAFATRGINLTKLESRPSKDQPWEYVFYVDLEGHMEDDICSQALQDLKGITSFIKILGSYPKSVV